MGTERGFSVRRLCSLLQGDGKGLDAFETLLRVFVERLEHHSLDSRRDRRDCVAQRRGRSRGLLIEHLYGLTLKRRSAAEPLVDDDAKRILIARRAGLSLDLLRGHILRRAELILCLEGRGTVCNSR